MAIGPIAAAFASQAIGNILQGRAESRRLQALAAELDKMAQVDTTQAEGAQIQQATQRSLRGLSERGVLNSSIAPGEVAAAQAPIQERAQRRVQDLRVGAATARSQAPGFGDAFGGALQDIGSFIALREGIEQGRALRNKRRLESLRDATDIGIDADEFGVLQNRG